MEQGIKAHAVGVADLLRILIVALDEGRRAIGDHWAPNDCYATGPITGNEYRDLVQCPACSFIAMYDDAKATAEATASTFRCIEVGCPFEGTAPSPGCLCHRDAKALMPEMLHLNAAFRTAGVSVLRAAINAAPAPGGGEG